MDIQLDQDFDLLVNDQSDLQIGNTTEQEARLLLNTHQGNWPDADLGIGQSDYEQLNKEPDLLPLFLEGELRKFGYDIKL